MFNPGDITVDLHALSGTYCQCDPKVENYPNGNCLVVHNTFEQARKKAN